MGHRHQPARGPEVQRWSVQGDEHAESHRHRRCAQREHQPQVEEPRCGPTAMDHDQRRQTANQHGQAGGNHGEEQRVAEGRQRRDRQQVDPVGQRCVVAQRPCGVHPPTGGERTLHQHGDRHAQHDGQEPQVPDQEPTAGPGQYPPDRYLSDGTTALHRVGDDHHRQHGHELHDGQGGGRGQVATEHRMTPYLGLQRGTCRPTQDEDHPERGEAEQEHDRGRSGHRRPEAGQGHPPEGLPRRGPEHTGLLLGAGVEALPEGAHRAQHYGHVEEDVGGQDRPDRPGQP